MSDPPTEQAPSMYCRRCGYALVGLSANRCPECGRAFDPGNPGTFLRRASAWWLRRVGKRVLQVLLAGLVALALLIAGFGGWLYWHYHNGWQAEQPAIAAIRRLGGTASARRDGPWQVRRFARLFGWDYMLQRIDQVDLPAVRIGEADLKPLAAFTRVAQLRMQSTLLDPRGLVHLKELCNLTSMHLSSGQRTHGTVDAGLIHLQHIRSLVVLDLTNTDTTDGGLQHLQGMTRLRFLSLFNAPVTDAGLAYLKNMTAMQKLFLGGTRITDAGLVNLQAMTRLEALYLTNTGVTDAGLAHLRGLTRLRYVDLGRTRVTHQGAEDLRVALPQASISGP